MHASKRPCHTYTAAVHEREGNGRDPTLHWTHVLSDIRDTLFGHTIPWGTPRCDIAYPQSAPARNHHRRGGEPGVNPQERPNSGCSGIGSRNANVARPQGAAAVAFCVRPFHHSLSGARVDPPGFSNGVVVAGRRHRSRYPSHSVGACARLAGPDRPSAPMPTTTSLSAHMDHFEIASPILSGDADGLIIIDSVDEDIKEGEPAMDDEDGGPGRKRSRLSPSIRTDPNVLSVAPPVATNRRRAPLLLPNRTSSPPSPVKSQAATRSSAPISCPVWEELHSRSSFVPPPMSGLTATFYDRQMLIFGGYNNNAALDGLYSLDLDTLEWTEVQTAGPRPSARTSHSAAIDPHNALLYIFGGSGSQFGHTNLNDLYVLDLRLRLWRQMALHGEEILPRYGQSMTWHNGRLYIFGGTFGREFSQDLFIVDTATGACRRMEQDGSAPTARYKHAAAIYNGSYMLVFGGAERQNYKLNDVAMLDLRTLKWTKLECTGTKPGGRFAHSMCIEGDTAFVFGGTDREACQSDLYMLNLSTRIWTKVGSAPLCALPHRHASLTRPRFRFSVVQKGDPREVDTFMAPFWIARPAR